MAGDSVARPSETPVPPLATRRGTRRRAAASAGNGRLRGAAFFDLDKTLMAGSSGIFFARAAYETGMISRASAGARRVREPALPPARLDRRSRR